MKKPTIKEVAKLANVSVSTVSRVMSDSPLIGLKTKEKVREIIKTLDYHPNYAAVSLSKNNSRIIATVVEAKQPNPLQNDYYTEILSYICKYASKRSYYVLYIQLQSPTDDAVETLIKTNRVDGVIFLNISNDNRNIEILRDNKVPYVIIGKSIRFEDSMWVDNDNLETCYNITKMYLNSGKKSIAFMAGPGTLTVSRQRKRGYERALKDRGVAVNQDLIIHTIFDQKAAYKEIYPLLQKRKIDAIITTDDILAIGCAQAAQKLNQKISITGFNKSRLRELMGFKFLTVDIQYEKLALHAINLLVDTIEGNKVLEKHVIVKTKIVKGD